MNKLEQPIIVVAIKLIEVTKLELTEIKISVDIHPQRL
jgi:hypothetical protein